MEKQWHDQLRMEVLGLDLEVPLYDGTKRPYLNLDNAATTPPLASVVQAIQSFFP